jgi:hypothetical protein
MQKKTRRTLYECGRAKVKGRRIYCSKGIALSREGDGSLDIKFLEEGHSLIMAVCQTCSEFLRIGQPVAEKERGWIKPKEAKHGAVAGKTL